MDRKGAVAAAAIVAGVAVFAAAALYFVHRTVAFARSRRWSCCARWSFCATDPKMGPFEPGSTMSRAVVVSLRQRFRSTKWQFAGACGWPLAVDRSWSAAPELSAIDVGEGDSLLVGQQRADLSDCPQRRYELVL